MSKRRSTQDINDELTPRKSRRIAQKDGSEQLPSHSQPAETPSDRKSILRDASTRVNGTIENGVTPRSIRKVLFSTPTERVEKVAPGTEQEDEAVVAERNALSARRKSARTLQVQSAADDSDRGEDEENAAIAKAILDEEEQDESEEGEIELAQPSSTNTTPSKRGRPRGKRRERTPSPPPDLPPHELYFFQNRTGANKTSSNALPPQLLLKHDDYSAQIKSYQDPHEEDIDTLAALHRRAFAQWLFELEEGFSICLYGYGSKRRLAPEFAEYMYAQAQKPPQVVVVNGYTPGLTFRDILTTTGNLTLPKNSKLPAQASPAVELILSHLTKDSMPITLIINSLDHRNLRKHSNLLARLAAHSKIHLLATCDTPNFALLWDVTLLRQFRWLYHDATTFQPYSAEIDVVQEVNSLLGRSTRSLSGKDGVGFVLKSLPENARGVFRILVAEQLANMDSITKRTWEYGDDDDDDDILGASDDSAAAEEQQTPSRRRRGRPPKSPKPPKPKKVSNSTASEGVEYRTLYHKAVEEFVCSSELNFRTLLKEFHDHQMVEVRRDAMGTERLSAPFSREELEGILESLA